MSDTVVRPGGGQMKVVCSVDADGNIVTDSSGNPVGNVVVSGNLVPGTVTTPTEENNLSGVATGGVVIGGTATNSLLGFAFCSNPTDYAEFRQNLLAGYVDTALLMVNDEIVIYPESGTYITDIYGVGIALADDLTGYCIEHALGSVAVGDVNTAHLHFNFSSTDQVTAVVMKLSGFAAAPETSSGEVGALLNISGRR